jgi:hypothetical protein
VLFCSFKCLFLDKYKSSDNPDEKKCFLSKQKMAAQSYNRFSFLIAKILKGCQLMCSFATKSSFLVKEGPEIN